jgi:hypothetical protein
VGCAEQCCAGSGQGSNLLRANLGRPAAESSVGRKEVGGNRDVGHAPILSALIDLG